MSINQHCFNYILLFLLTWLVVKEVCLSIKNILSLEICWIIIKIKIWAVDQILFVTLLPTLAFLISTALLNFLLRDRHLFTCLHFYCAFLSFFNHNLQSFSQFPLSNITALAFDIFTLLIVLQFEFCLLFSQVLLRNKSLHSFPLILVDFFLIHILFPFIILPYMFLSYIPLRSRYIYVAFYISFYSVTSHFHFIFPYVHFPFSFLRE